MPKKITYQSIYFQVTGHPDEGQAVHLGYTDDPRRNAIYYMAGGWKAWQLKYKALIKINPANEIAKPEGN